MHPRTILGRLAAALMLAVATALPAAADKPERVRIPALVVINANPCLTGGGAITLQGELTVTVQETPHGRRQTEVLHLEGSSIGGQRYLLHFHGHVPQGVPFTNTVQGRGRAPDFLATIAFQPGSGLGDVSATTCPAATLR